MDNYHHGKYTVQYVHNMTWIMNDPQEFTVNGGSFSIFWSFIL